MLLLACGCLCTMQPSDGDCQPGSPCMLQQKLLLCLCKASTTTITKHGHTSRKIRRVNKAKTISRRKRPLEHSSNHNYSYGGDIGLGLEEN